MTPGWRAVAVRTVGPTACGSASAVLVFTVHVTPYAPYIKRGGQGTEFNWKNSRPWSWVRGCQWDESEVESEFLGNSAVPPQGHGPTREAENEMLNSNPEAPGEGETSSIRLTVFGVVLSWPWMKQELAASAHPLSLIIKSTLPDQQQRYVALQRQTPSLSHPRKLCSVGAPAIWPCLALGASRIRSQSGTPTQNLVPRFYVEAASGCHAFHQTIAPCI